MKIMPFIERFPNGVYFKQGNETTRRLYSENSF
jgi:hypothetical protein